MIFLSVLKKKLNEQIELKEVVDFLFGRSLREQVDHFSENGGRLFLTFFRRHSGDLGQESDHHF